MKLRRCLSFDRCPTERSAAGRWIRLLTVACCVLSFGAGAGEKADGAFAASADVLVDFSSPGVLGAARGARLEGTRLVIDAAERGTNAPNHFAVPVKGGTAVDCANRVLSLFVRFGEPLAAEPTLSLDFTDADGEVFRYKPVFKVRELSGLTRLDYAVVENGTCYPSWGKAKNGRFDGALRLTTLLGSFSRFVSRGELEYVRLENRARTWAKDGPAFSVETDNDLPLIHAPTDAVRFVFRNRRDVRVRWKGTLRLRDFSGRGFDRPLDLDLGAGASVAVAASEPFGTMGVWYAQADLLAADGTVAYVKDQFARIDRREATPLLPKPKFRFGLNYHADWYSDDVFAKTLDVLVKCGVKLVRVGGFHGSTVMKREGVCDWTKADRIHGALRSRGISVHANVYGMGVWARKSGYPTKSLPPHSYDIPPREGLFGDYCERIARRYGTTIDYYEMGNEWDLDPVEYLPPDEASRILREGYAGIKRGEPKATVTTCGWAGADTGDLPFNANPGLIERFAREEQPFFDVWALHLHGPFAEYAQRMQKRAFPLLKRSGMTKPWYADECALSSHYGEDAAARAVWQKIVYAWAWGSTDYIWYNLRDVDGAKHEPSRKYGIVTSDFRPKASLAAFSSLVSLLEGGDFEARVVEEPQRHLYRFRAPDGCSTVYVGWADDAGIASVYRIPTAANRVVRVDLMGNRREEPVKDGCIEFTIDFLPSALCIPARP